MRTFTHLLILFSSIWGENRLIVVLGSSTAEGVGPLYEEESWVSLFEKHLETEFPEFQVKNLALRGNTTYEILPSNTRPPLTRPWPDTACNISKALSLEPSALLVNLPSNDAGKGFTLEEQLNNFEIIFEEARSAAVPIWISTTQPRNLSKTQRNNLVEVREKLLERYGERVVDFWTAISKHNGKIKFWYDSGDGIHLNRFGHWILFERVLSASIPERILSDSPWNTVQNPQEKYLREN